MVVGFVAKAKEAIGTCEGDHTCLVELVLALTMDDWVFVTMDSTGFAGVSTALVGFLINTTMDGMGLVELRSS